MHYSFREGVPGGFVHNTELLKLLEAMRSGHGSAVSTPASASGGGGASSSQRHPPFLQPPPGGSYHHLSSSRDDDDDSTTTKDFVPDPRCPHRFVTVDSDRIAPASADYTVPDAVAPSGDGDGGPDNARRTSMTTSTNNNSNHRSRDGGGGGGSVGTDGCAPRCDVDVLYRSADRRFATAWMAVWSAVGFAATSSTVLTFLVDTSRFRYPERPVVFLAFCYAVYSAVFFLRLGAGPSTIACDRTAASTRTGGIVGGGVPFLVREGLESTWCVVVFLALYFFGMAGAVWWVVLTVSFYLAAARKWGREAIEALGGYFHLVAWAVPAVKTIVVLVMRRVDGDELTGLCYVGNQDAPAAIGFVVVPLVVYLVVGSSFIGAGFAAMFRIRNDLKGHDRGGRVDVVDVGARNAAVKSSSSSAAAAAANVKNLEKLMAKIGIFAVLYAVPSTCIVGCLFYELVNRDRWMETARATDCRLVVSPSSSSGSSRPTAAATWDCNLERAIPSVEVHMLKLFVQLAVGTTCGLWIWSPKTLHTWRAFAGRVLPCCGGDSRRRRPTTGGGGGSRPHRKSSIELRAVTTFERGGAYQAAPQRKCEGKALYAPTSPSPRSFTMIPGRL